MTKYKIPEQFGDLEIMPVQIKMQGFAGAPLDNDLSPGGFFVDLVLIVGADPNPIAKKLVRVFGTTQPVDTTDLVSIKTWAIEQLDAQFGVE